MKYGNEVQYINVSSDKKYFEARDKRAYLQCLIEPHDVLLVGSPVYAHHFQYHMLDLIDALPEPDSIWGAIAIPFVTYGGISSGIALEEAAKHLDNGGRTVVAGFKASCSHKMTRAFFDKEYNSDPDIDGIKECINDLVNRICTIDLDKPSNNSRSLNYQDIGTHIKARFVFQEKKWHEERYPNIRIIADKCNNCGLCAKNCAVIHLSKGEKTPMTNISKACIHCFNCVANCPKGAIQIEGELDKAKEFFAKNSAKAKETPVSAVYPLNK